jgi:hypothetical protein
MNVFQALQDLATKIATQNEYKSTRIAVMSRTTRREWAQEILDEMEVK